MAPPVQPLSPMSRAATPCRRGWLGWGVVLWGTGCEQQGVGPVDEGPAAWDRLVYVVRDDAPETVPGTWAIAFEASATPSEDGETWVGELSYEILRNTVTTCDLRVSLTGTAVSGVCEDCDFAFQVFPEVLDQGDSDCTGVPVYTLLADEKYKNLYLGFATFYPVTSAYSFDLETYHDVMMVGHGLDYSDIGGGYYPGPYWSWASWDGPYVDQGWADWDGQTLSWGLDEFEAAYFHNYYNSCYTTDWSEANTFYNTGEVVTGEVDCIGTVMDGWGVQLHAGQDVTVSVDSPDPDAYFTPTVFINGPDGCAVAKAKENYTCTSYQHDPGEWSENCASMRFTVPASGPHQIWIASTGYECYLGESVPYTLYIDVY